MNTQLDTRALALAGAVTGAALLALCFTLYAALRIVDPWMPLFLGSGPTVAGWLVGIAEGAAVGGFIGAVTAAAYNRMAGRQRSPQ